ncbi:DNA (cytosine-5-)-methyltransferase [Rhizobium laguerreae]|uniref:DNA cytosine methyltransferase n=1 Tax=Rhizobium laguerreae TaxID=1076926 RepID=UPI001C914471|nr:DNA (cytosine-5-)-methyltransferase [Rhizobium laguerreae]MBY3155432.1 DNA (cytosine-5-)-methyltransferase [Rhizobium laguerreae]
MPSFTFIDLFAGIGGMRQAAEENGGTCVFSSEINREAAGTYEANFGERPYGDITKIDESDIPEHDVIFGGFPCQPFSICGFKRGFDDARGTLFFDILRIAKAKRPSCLVLENVKHFASHDRGNTLGVVVAALEEIGYSVSVEVINAVDFGLPQNRDRTIIVASRIGTFDFSKLVTSERLTVSSVLETEGPFEYVDPAEYTLLRDDIVKVQKQSGLRFVGYRNRNLRKVGVREGTEHLSRVHKQPNRIYCATAAHPTLAAGESSGRYWILVDGVVRKLTQRECYRLQGFPDSFKISASATAAYRQIGNSVPVPMIAEVVRAARAQGLITIPADTEALLAA